MKTIISLILAILCFKQIKAQQFIQEASIEFEVKNSIKKSMGNDSWDEMMKENLPNFKIAYFKFSFSNNKSIYKLDRFDEKVKLPDYMKRDDEENEWYIDHNIHTIDMKKIVLGSPVFVKDSLPPIEWKLTNESMVIAGFNCRKAIGKIFDSVYVFAFYTDEIMISGGPCSISGLPGMIMAMTIPRLFTSWVATKVDVTNTNESSIKPINAKKPLLNKEFKNLIADRTKDWEIYYKDDKSVIRRFMWNALL